ncbi:rRNA-processing protein las1 [Coemansia sp. RSA 2522]|nr:rRNA-processing protein las1 [Coemansia sp. RSA 522]KAJ2432793.1 rRNA-processing protein las1 [Coemansia sp. RSA 2522]
MSRGTRLVAWTSTAEYVAVGELLYSELPQDRHRGVLAVKAWRARARVPAAVDATATLVELQLSDSTQPVSQQRLTLSMALIRFVNSILDLEQRTTVAQSMAVLARRIGMPAWFVELRHACTHEQVPSLRVLRAAHAHALVWLDEHYWRRQTRALPEDTRDRVRAAVAEYVRARDTVKAAATKRNASEFDAAKAALVALTGVLHSDAVGAHVVRVLLEPGVLVPTDKRMRAKFPECTMPSQLARQSTSLLRLLADVWGESVLFDELLSAICSALVPQSSEGGFEPATLGPSHAATLVAWVRWILDKHYQPAGSDTPSNVSVDDLLETCLRNPGYYSRAVLKAVSDVDPALGRDLRPFVDYMGKALAALAAADARPVRSTVDAEEMRKEEELMQTRLDSMRGSAGSMDVDMGADESVEADEPETLQPDSRWAYDVRSGSPCPIGTLADGCVPDLELPLWIDDIPLFVAPA